MTRDELLEECFGRSDFPAPNRAVELTQGRDVVSHVDIYLRRLHVRFAGDLAVEGRGVETATTITVASLENLCTDPGRRGQGYAGAMIRRALSELRENRPIRFVLVRAADDRVWQAQGFAPAEGLPRFLVAKLRNDPWPRARFRPLGDWPL